MKRFATVRGADSESHLNQYIDNTNFKIIGVFGDKVFIIAGEDSAGWNLDDYVIPRLASGLIWAAEITEPLFERNQGVIPFEDSIVLATVVDVRTLTVVTFDGFEPEINRIPAEFRLHLEYNDQLEKFQMRNFYAYRKDVDGVFYHRPVTDSQRGKLYKHFLEVAQGLPARVLLAGQTNGIELEISAKESELDRLKIKVVEAESKIRQLRIQLEAQLVS